MTEKQTPAPSQYSLADPVQFAQNMAQGLRAGGRTSPARWRSGPSLAKQEAETQVTPMEQVTKTLGAVAQSYMADPQKLMDAQMQLWNSYTQLWQNAWARVLGQHTAAGGRAQPAPTSASRTRTGRKTPSSTSSSSST